VDEAREEAREAVRYRVWSGYYDRGEVYDIVRDDVLELDEEQMGWLRGTVAREFRKKRAAERGWPAVTDCDRLDRVFEALRGRRVLTRHRCGLTIQDGLGVIDLLYADEGGERSGLVGYCFYHIQDMEGAIWGDRGLFLAFGGFPPSPAGAVAVGQIVREEFERAGFAVEWDGTAGTRVRLPGFRWQRRSPGAEPSAAADPGR
jgi:hypothetical protein